MLLPPICRPRRMLENMAHNLLISENFPPHVGGSSRWFYELYGRLPHAQQTIVAGAHPDAAAWDAAQPLRIERLPLRMPHWGLSNVQALRNYASLWRHVGRLESQLKRRHHTRPVLHAGRVLPEGWLAWLLSRSHGLTYAVYVHGEDVTTAATSREYRWMVQRVLRRARIVIANSHNTASILTNDWQLPASRVHVLHPGVDLERFGPAPRDEAFRAELGWSGRQVILTVGRLQQRKGHDRLIEALAHLRQQYPQVLYAVCGDGEERPTLERLIAQHQLQSHVQLLGEVADERLRQCYQQCDLFALPNRAVGQDIEGFGMVLLEAQACGKPVLAGDSGGTRETLQPGVTGWIADCSEVAPLYRALADALSDPLRLEIMGVAARKWVREHFDWDVLARQAQALFNELGKPAARDHTASSPMPAAIASHAPADMA
jgi:phosphatidylinositol alpha-1,6-mannosyltransferase